MNTEGPDRIGVAIVIGCMLLGVFGILVPTAVKSVTAIRQQSPTLKEIRAYKQARIDEYNRTVCAKCHGYCSLEDRPLFKKAKRPKYVKGDRTDE